MYDVLEFDVALPLAAIAAAAVLGVITGDIARQEGQAGDADRGEVVVVTRLPGALVSVGEIVDLDEVDQVRVAAVDVGIAGVTVHLLIGEADLVATQAVAHHAVPGLVVDLAGIGCAGVITDHQAQVGGQRRILAQRLHSLQIEEVLTIDVVQLGGVVGADQLFREVIARAGKGQVIGLGSAVETTVLVVDLQLLRVGRSTVDDLVQTPAGQGQTGHVLRHHQGAFEYLGEGSAVAGGNHRRFRDVAAVTQFGFRELRLGRQTEAAELVRRAAIVAHWQQIGVGAATAGIQFDAEHPHGI